jgi:Peptidase_C39 like family
VKTFSFLAAILFCVSVGSTYALEPDDPQASPKTILLEIPDISQEPRTPSGGWCCETTIQMALSYYGVYASQKVINRAAKPEHPDIWAHETPRAMTNMGLEFSSWKEGSLEDFMKWVRGQLAKGRPVLLGMKIYPDEHPEWARDHVLLGVGYTEHALTYNTTWGKRETKSFAGLSSKDKGLSFANRHHQYLGYGIMGMKMDSHQTGRKPTRLTITRSDDNKHVQLRIRMEKLIKGNRYQLLKFHDLKTAEQAEGTGEVIRSFVADGPQATFSDRVRIDDVRVYRCVPSPNQ